MQNSTIPSRKVQQRNLEAALALAALGLKVFPCNPEGRKPFIKWKEGASADPAVIRDWWRKWPRALPCLPTGPVNGLSVIDLDEKEGKHGIAAWRDLGHDPDAAGLVVETTTGGRHLYFHDSTGVAPTNAGDIAPGVDSRGAGGFVIAPGAVLPDGRAYRILSGDVESVAIGFAPDFPAVVSRRKAGGGSGASLDVEAAREAVRSGEAYHHPLMQLAGAYSKAGVAYIEIVDNLNTLMHEVPEADRDSRWRDRVKAIPDQVRAAMGYREADRQAAEAYRAELPTRFGPSPEEIDAFLDGEAPHEAVPLELMRRKNGAPYLNLTNTIRVLTHHRNSILPGLRMNDMTGLVESRDGEVTDIVLSLTRSAVETCGLPLISQGNVDRAVDVVAKAYTYHPIRDYLAPLRHDGEARLDDWLVRLAGAADTPYVRAVGRKWLIAMVARVMRPGCKHDHVPVLVGPQGAGKSRLCRALAGAAYFSDTLPSITGERRDAMLHLQGKWMVELAELAPSRKSESEDLKAFLSGQDDTARAPYGKRDCKRPRQCVLVGTTNDHEFLRDATGGRRFWPVTVGKVIDVEGLEEERDQLFAEALAAFKAGEEWWMDRDFEAEHARPVQEAAYESDPWTEAIADWLDNPKGDFEEIPEPRNEVTTAAVMTEALALGAGQQTTPTQRRVSDILRRMGWTRVKTMGRMVWRRPDAGEALRDHRDHAGSQDGGMVPAVTDCLDG